MIGFSSVQQRIWSRFNCKRVLPARDSRSGKSLVQQLIYCHEGWIGLCLRLARRAWLVHWSFQRAKNNMMRFISFVLIHHSGEKPGTAACLQPWLQNCHGPQMAFSRLSPVPPHKETKKSLPWYIADLSVSQRGTCDDIQSNSIINQANIWVIPLQRQCHPKTICNDFLKAKHF